MRRVWSAAIVAAALMLAGRASAQTLLDRVLVRVNDDIVTLSDVNQARLLHLTPPDAVSDAAIVDALISRRLMLIEVARYPSTEPTEAEIAARRRDWQASLGPNANAAELLRRGGMTDALLTGWLRDDVRIQAYLDRRFSQSTIPRRDVMLAYYQEHQSEFTRGGVRLTFEEALDDVRKRVSARDHAAQIAKWLDGLRSRADIAFIR